MALTNRLRAAIVAMGTFVLLAPLQAPAAQAISFKGGSAVIVGSKCSAKLPWNGGMPTGIAAKRWPKGKVQVCFFKYRIKDADPQGAYFAVRAVSTWTGTTGGTSYPAEMHQVVTSSLPTKDNVRGATNDFTSGESCSSPLSVSFGLGPFGISTTPKMCKGYKLDRYIYNGREAYWRSARAGGLRTVETSFAQKVGNKQVPRFDIFFAIPRYKNTWYKAGGYWRTTKQVHWVTFLDK